MKISLAQRQLEGLHVQPVAGQHRNMISPDNICGRPPATRFGDINYVVMH